MRTTISINDKVYKALRLRSAESGESMSAIVENAVKYQILEDLEDIEDANRRSREPSLNFDDLVRELKTEGLL